MKDLLAGLGARERFLLLAGGIVIAVVLLYGLVWKPLGDRVASLRVTVAEQGALHQWMQASAQEIRQLRGQQRPVAGERASLLSLTDRTARERGLGTAIRRVEPEGSDKVRIQLEQVPFDDMAGWLEHLVSRHDVRIELITIDAREQSGLVNARLTLESPGT
jgi:general secretion pathway protein M